MTQAQLKPRGPWSVLSERLVYENSWMKVREYDVRRPDGSPGLYGVVSPKNLAIGVLPVFADGTTMLVGQHRFALDAHSWELPEGGGPLDHDPQTSARRELAEETGLTARRWLKILDFDVSNSITDERAIAFLAWDLHAGEAAPEPAEHDMVRRRMSIQQALRMAMEGEIRDGFTLAILARADYMARNGQLDEDTAAAILARPRPE
jgi:8-oxo-dGTP pyrophosphatase MutT (NUDIX family)